MLIPLAATPSELAPAPPPGGGSPGGASSGADAAPGFAQALQRQSAAPAADARRGDGDRAAASRAEPAPARSASTRTPGALAAAHSAPARPTGAHDARRGATRCSTEPAISGLAPAPADAKPLGATPEASPTTADGRAAASVVDEHDAAAHDPSAAALPELLAWMAHLAQSGSAASASPEPARAADTEARATAGSVAGAGGALPPGQGAAAAALAAGLVPALDRRGASEAATPGTTTAPSRADAPGTRPATARSPLAARDETATAAEASAAPARPPRDEAPLAAAPWLSPAGAAAQPAQPHADAELGSRSDGATAAALPTAPAVPSRPAPLDAPAVPLLELRERVDSDAFAPALGARLAVLVRDGIEHAQLRLNPAEMGPIDVRIRLDGTQAQVDFSAAHAHTRHTLQEAVPALAGALREAGLTLAGGGVFEQARDTPAQPRHDTPPRPGGRQDQADMPAAATPAAATPPARTRGVVDLYA